MSASAVAKMNSMGQLASSSQSSQSLLLPSSPFASLTPSCETLQALDRVVHIARDYIESISGNNGIAVRHIPTLTSTGKGSFVEGIARRKKMQLVTDPSSVYVADEKAGFIQSQDLAVSFMFAVAVLKESLGALLEVAFLLSDEDILSSTEINYCDPSLGRPDAKSPIELPSKQLRVSSVVKDYADRLFTTAKDTTTPSVAGGALSSESFFSESKQADSDSTPSLFNASDWHHDPYLTRGDKQAIDIMYAAAEIGGGLKTAFSIDDDVYFDVLVCMVERGVALLHQAAVYRQMGNQLSYEIIINNRRARKSIFLMSAALKIVFFGLQRVSLEKKSSGSFNKTLLDIRCLSDSLIHPNELIPIERETVSNNLPRSPLGALPAVDANQVKSSASSSSSSSSSSEVIAETYRTRLCQIIDILVTNPLLQPESSFIGQSIVLYASMFDLLRPKASDQFAIICALLEKSDSSVETPCERALVVSLMSGMEGPKLLELITPTVSQDGDVDSSEEGDVEKFVRSILMLADRSLSSKIKKIVEISKSRSLSIDDKTVGKFSLAPVATGPTTQSTTEDVGEGILKVLEPTTIQTFCNLCQCVSQSSEEGNEAKLAHYQMKLIELLINLLFSARSTIEQLVASFDAFESRCASESEGSFESTLVDMYRRLDDQMKRSHVANLVPLVLFGSTLLWRHLINSGKRNQAKCLVNLFEPLHLIAKSLTPFINFEKRFRSILNADPDNNMPISSEPVVVSVPSIASWDPSLSNSNLEFTDDNLSCRRPGSASCYPAAFAQFPANKCSFSVTLSETLSTTNWLTIGVCASGFATSSSDGFGRSSNSWYTFIFALSPYMYSFNANFECMFIGELRMIGQKNQKRHFSR